MAPTFCSGMSDQCSGECRQRCSVAPPPPHGCVYESALCMQDMPSKLQTPAAAGADTARAVALSCDTLRMSASLLVNGRGTHADCSTGCSLWQTRAGASDSALSAGRRPWVAPQPHSVQSIVVEARGAASQARKCKQQLRQTASVLAPGWSRPTTQETAVRYSAGVSVKRSAGTHAQHIDAAPWPGGTRGLGTGRLCVMTCAVAKCSGVKASQQPISPATGLGRRTAAEASGAQWRGFAVSTRGHQPSTALREIGNQQLRSFVESPGMLAESYTCVLSQSRSGAQLVDDRVHSVHTATRQLVAGLHAESGCSGVQLAGYSVVLDRAGILLTVVVS